ncbi:nucleotide exchange factor Fes1-domain-containing protein [Podospora appendiculata]|uniref:Nucleotide exchange factor Fes1-domain-containing protein n=1 Tax=Podospora appendiculata TaxID=314037 RepID=A0AAE0X6Q8_9PEZI|nr:nucleotide exchange factor Fes1-domain-containing protein [Podospora appendiculata]
MDKQLNGLLKWGIQNSVPPTSTSTSATAVTSTDADPSPIIPPTPAPLDQAALAALLFGGGPSDADLMKAAIEVITDTDPTNTLENKLIAFDNFEQLIEGLDNANNLETLSLWTPLLSLLEHDESELRRMAAWCVGTAVQNNAKTQERLFALGGIPTLVKLATRAGEAEGVRRKAVYALSSAVRNYQPAMDAASQAFAELGHADKGAKVDAGDMDAVDEVMNWLKQRA